MFFSCFDAIKVCFDLLIGNFDSDGVKPVSFLKILFFDSDYSYLFGAVGCFFL